MKNALAEYLVANNIAQGDFAKALDVAPAMVSLWVHDLRRPNLDNAFAIERVTKGAIKAKYWTTLPEAGRPDTHTVHKAG